MIHRWMPALALLLLTTSASAVEPISPVPLVSGNAPATLAGHVAVLRDDAARWTLADVREPGIAARFERSDAAAFNLGVTGSAYWFRFVLRNPADSASAWVLELSHPVLDHLDVHVTSSDGHTITVETGDRRQQPALQLPHRKFAIPLDLSPGEDTTVHVRLANAGVLLLDLQVWPRDQWLSRTAVDTLTFGLVYGCLLLLVLYNFFIFIWIGDRACLLFAVFALAVGLLSFVYSGHARQYGNDAFHLAPALISASLPILSTLTSAAYLLFSRDFMALAQHAPRGSRWVNVLLGAHAAAVLAGILHYPLGVWLGNGLTVVSFTVVLAIAVPLARRGVRSAVFYLLASTMALLATVAWLLEVYAVLPTTVFREFGWALGVCLCGALLALALADKIATERRERERLSRLKQFLAPAVAEAIVGESSLLAARRREVTVVFTDLRGFTAFCASSEPEEVMGVLREYRETVVQLAARHRGTLEHFSGDGVMTYFNAPLEVAEPERSAARMAIDIQRELEVLRAEWTRRGHDLGIGIGIASGFAAVGAVGFGDRMDYSVIGSVTNLAARLCQNARHGQILVSRKLLLKLDGLAAADLLGEQELKGMPKPVTVYNLRSLAAT